MPYPACNRFGRAYEGLRRVDSMLKYSVVEALTEFCERGSRDSYLRHVEASVKAPINRVAP